MASTARDALITRQLRENKEPFNLAVFNDALTMITTLIILATGASLPLISREPILTLVLVPELIMFAEVISFNAWIEITNNDANFYSASFALGLANVMLGMAILIGLYSPNFLENLKPGITGLLGYLFLNWLSFVHSIIENPIILIIISQLSLITLMAYGSSTFKGDARLPWWMLCLQSLVVGLEIMVISFLKLEF